jgi:hypothetical protein
VDVLIRLEQPEPPVGMVLPLRDPDHPMFESGGAVPFIGWLGLLRALSEIVGEPDD